MDAEATVVNPETRLARIIEEQHIEPVNAQALVQAFQPMFEQAAGLVMEAEKIHVTDATQVTEIKLSRKLRLDLRKVRISVEAARKQFKERALREGKAIDGIAAVAKLMIEPVEERLLAQEEFAERKEAQRKADLCAARAEALRPYGVDPTFYALGDMGEDAFQQLFSAQKRDFEARQEAARKAEEARLAAEKAKAEEEARIRAENERLKREQEALAAKAKAEREEAERDRRALEAAAKKEREEAEAKLAAERKAAEEAARKAQAEADAKLAAQRAEAERVAKAEADKARKEREEAEELARKEKAVAEAKAKKEREAAAAKLAEERKAREKLEREAAAKAEAEKKAAEEAERARRKAEAAPDNEKLLALAKSLREYQLPDVKSAEAMAIANMVGAGLASLADQIDRALAEDDSPALFGEGGAA